MSEPALIDLSGTKQFRIIPSHYPPINFFEELVNSSDMEALYEIEGLTNDRLRQEIGDIFQVAKEDRVSGSGSAVVMAAFTHIGKQTRFSDGTFGIYYASLDLETAIRETVYHREYFYRCTQEPVAEITMRTYEGNIVKSFHDVRAKKYAYLHHKNDYMHSQVFGKELKDKKSWGLIYNSVRHTSGNCIAVLRPPAVSIPMQTKHLRYIWNGERITEVFDTHSILKLF